jgi:hypothetical protein
VMPLELPHRKELLLPLINKYTIYAFIVK